MPLVLEHRAAWVLRPLRVRAQSNVEVPVLALRASPDPGPRGDVRRLPVRYPDLVECSHTNEGKCREVRCRYNLIPDHIDGPGTYLTREAGTATLGNSRSTTFRRRLGLRPWEHGGRHDYVALWPEPERTELIDLLCEQLPTTCAIDVANVADASARLDVDAVSLTVLANYLGTTRQGAAFLLENVRRKAQRDSRRPGTRHSEFGRLVRQLTLDRSDE